ncbi:hypothetical protein SADUNF_Sadunf16G0108500 [Salix dunnii]|uniref:Leucine-rich repeat-containing N-terminal plant-type domain-containing protein n=1 Tax=Salix dunnii TaxID=1413687 RepID=A0A835MLG2_9ROSI|nr:hypothetical protein SADUNF_Sadunf16G0108500 [Salix dunnii]
MPTFSRSVTMRMLLLLILSFFHLRACHSSPSMQPLCHDEEGYALLQFKQSLVINKSASSNPSAYPKVASWKVDGESGDCCSWDGVECDRDSGHVTGLDLSSSLLYGSIDSNSSLFHLVHLRRLNLADNDFNKSTIPSEIRYLSRLFDLNLSLSAFSGQIPAEILELSKLVSLDLGLNYLKLQKPGLQHLVEALTNLEVLHLSGVDISAKVPQIMANLSSLSSLFLRDCGLQGEFAMGIFQLPNLRFLSIRYNQYLTGYLPEFQSGSQLELLFLTEASFSGQLPESIGNLKSLKEFDVAGCNFSGAIPSSLGNLTKLNYLDLSYNSLSGKIPSTFFNLTKLNYLDLSYNSFSGKIPSTFANLLQLANLSLSSNNFSSGTLHWLCNLTKLKSIALNLTNSYGEIPSCLGNLTRLAVLRLSQNNLAGQIPSWIGNHTLFTSLMLGSNGLHGPIPESIFRLPNLEALDLEDNLFRGTVNVGLLSSRSLVSFQLNGNNLSVIGNSNDSVALPKFRILGLGGCNLSGEFPSFLHGQNQLEFVELGGNKIEGHIPKWFMNLATETLLHLDLFGNFLTGFEQSVDILPWNKLRYLRLSGNKLEGALPIPPRSTIIYIVSDNRLTGEIPPAICNLTSLVILQLSNNILNSKLPQCLGNISNSASVLDLRNNSFSGDIPDAFSSNCTLRAIDISQNQLEGKIPRSLANCTKLEILNIEKNKINDVFPSWLGIFPKLRVLILRSNRLHGMIGKPRANFDFQRLQIVDLSDNYFLGKLPLEYFRNWTAMKTIYKERPLYMQVVSSFQLPGFGMTYHFDYSMTITNKGLCGKPLSRKCGNGDDTLPAAKRDEGWAAYPLEFGWKVVVTGYASGLVIGVILGCVMDTRKYEWLINDVFPSCLDILPVLRVLILRSNRLHRVIGQPKNNVEFPMGNFPLEYFRNWTAMKNVHGDHLINYMQANISSNSLPAAKRHEGSAAHPLEFGWKVVVTSYASGLVTGVILGCVMDTRKYEWLVNNYYIVRLQRIGQNLKTHLHRS